MKHGAALLSRSTMPNAQHANVGCTRLQQASIDAPETDSTPPSVGGGARIRDLNAADETSGVATDNAVVGSLIGAGDAEAAGASGEAASVPSAEEGFNLWEGEREGGEVIAQRDTASMQVTSYE